jgi:hypothetical protein
MSYNVRRILLLVKKILETQREAAMGKNNMRFKKISLARQG